MTTQSRLRPGWAVGFAAFVLSIVLSILFVDAPLARWTATLDPTLRAICARLTTLGDSKWYLVPLGIAVPALYFASRNAATSDAAARLRLFMRAAAFIFLAIALSGLAADLLKIFFGRARPPLLLGGQEGAWRPFSLKAKFHSFPSGHADTVFALAAALGLFLPRLRSAFFAYALVIAATRVAIDAHYLADVVAGGAFGIVSTYFLRDAALRRGLLSPGEIDSRGARERA
jgi:membrane-associated phospholipid phosphatase